MKRNIGEEKKRQEEVERNRPKNVANMNWQIVMRESSFLPQLKHIETEFDKVKFKHKVVPGDTVLFKMELLTPMRRGIIEMRGSAYVGNKLVSEAELMAKIQRKEGK